MGKKEPTTISIVTPSLNQGEFIADTIESVLSQAGDFYLDYIIMDGGSTDGSVEIIKKYEGMLQNSWPVRCRGIEYRWFSGADGGQVSALNKGLSMAKGEILCWLNSDDMFYPGALHKVTRKNWHETDFCYGRGMWIGRNGKAICYYPTFSPNRFSLQSKCTLCQPAVFFTHKVYLALGPLSSEYSCVFDYEYWLRAVFNGCNFRFISAPLAQSRMYAQNKSLLNQRLAEREAAILTRSYYKDKKLNPLLRRMWTTVVKNVTLQREKRLAREMNAG